MKVLRNIIVNSEHHNKPIVTDVFYKETQAKKPVVIFCHGYKGYKDWGAWNEMANEFVEKYLFFVKFNFSHNGGTAKDPIDFPDLEAFGLNNFILELDDLDTIIEWVTNNADFKDEIDTTNITLIGHSRGGGTVTIKASENAKISKVVSWCGVSDFGARFPVGEELEGWKNAGVAYIENARTKQQMPHYFQFYTNFKKHEKRLTIRNAVEKLTIPQLVIYGEEDDVVLPVEAKNMHAWNPKSKLIEIKKMDHSLGSVQPWKKKEMPLFLNEAVEKTIGFIKEN